MEVGHGYKNFFEKKSSIIFHILIILLLLLFIINTFSLLNISKKVNEKTREATEAAKLAIIQTMTLLPKGECTGCNLKELTLVVRAFNVTSAKEIKADTKEGQTLLQKYKIEKLPALIILGELNKTGLNVTQVEDALIYTLKNPPYYDVQTQRFSGLVKVNLVEADNCAQCFSLDPFIASLQEEIFITNITKLKESEAKNFLNIYNLTKLPALIISQDAEVYKSFTEAWKQFGERAKDGSYLLKDINPPYKEVMTGLTRGLVTITYISDKTCKTCYDVKNHKVILANRLGISLVKEKELDITEAQQLLDKYKIKAVPTIILSSEIKDYKLEPVLTKVGTYELDNTFVFREVEVMGTYKDLKTEKIIEQKQPAQ